MTPHTADGSGGNHTISESEIIDGAFLAALGLRLTEISGTRVRGEIELGPDHHTPWGVVHGGVYTTAVESVASVGASAAVLDRGQVAVGVANNTDFLRPLTGGTVEVVAIADPTGTHPATVAGHHHQRRHRQDGGAWAAPACECFGR